MFDYTMLNDHEFEILCRDIFQIELREKLFFFPRGIDQGIDICDKNNSPSNLIQAKHYVKSTYGQFISSLKKEVPKVEMHKPKRYFIITTLSLTRKNKLEIYSLFSEYMEDISNVWGKEDIDSFLKESQNSDIVQQNFKLWLNASNVLSIIQNQNVFLDSDELLEDIKSKTELFVSTNTYTEAIEKMRKENILIIVGAPGVGKSTISEMILLYYIDKGYAVRYVTNNNLPDLKKTISLENSKKELILLDDFLGQHYLKIKEGQSNELRTLLSFVGRSSSKKIILNSRITILNEARVGSIKLNELMEKYDSQKYLIDLNKISRYEKAKIFYNHLYFNNVPEEYLNNIKIDSNYMKIISHKNYNPRIIEYVTKKRNYKLIPSEEYSEYILSKLNHPADIWRDEFQNRMGAEDRSFMNTLYSLTDTEIEISILEQAFNARIRDENNLDTTMNHFEKVMERLTESLITIKIKNGERYISVLNPSINDYLLKELSTNVNEQLKIIKHAVFFEQIIRSNNSYEAEASIEDILYSDGVLKFKTLKNSMYFYFLQQLKESEQSDEKLYDKTRAAIEFAYKDLEIKNYGDYSKIICRIFNSRLLEEFKLFDFFNSHEKLNNIIKNMNINSIINIFLLIKNRYIINDPILECFKLVMEDVIIEEVEEKMMYRTLAIADQIIENELNLQEISHEEIEMQVGEELNNVILEELGILYKKLPDELLLDNNDYIFESIRDGLNINDVVSDTLRSNEMSENPYIKKRYEDEEIIKAMFER